MGKSLLMFEITFSFDGKSSFASNVPRHNTPGSIMQHPGTEGPEQQTEMFQGIRQGFAVCKGQQTHLRLQSQYYGLGTYAHIQVYTYTVRY